MQIFVAIFEVSDDVLLEVLDRIWMTDLADKKSDFVTSS